MSLQFQVQAIRAKLHERLYGHTVTGAGTGMYSCCGDCDERFDRPATEDELDAARQVLKARRQDAARKRQRP